MIKPDFQLYMEVINESVKTHTNMQYKKFGSKWFSKVGAPHQFSVTVDRNAARTPKLFILQERYVAI